MAQVKPRLAYVPGMSALNRTVIRGDGYRTWHGLMDMGWCWECLLCGDWGSSEITRQAAVAHASVRHRTYCHAVQGCHCPQPHLSTEQAERLGVCGGGQYPYDFGGILFRLADGVRPYCPPSVDRNGVPHGPYYMPHRAFTRYVAAFMLALHQAATARQRAA